jgi:transcription elongation factor Elf1
MDGGAAAMKSRNGGRERELTTRCRVQRRRREWHRRVLSTRFHVWCEWCGEVASVVCCADRSNRAVNTHRCGRCRRSGSSQWYRRASTEARRETATDDRRGGERCRGAEGQKCSVGRVCLQAKGLACGLLSSVNQSLQSNKLASYTRKQRRTINSIGHTDSAC